MSCKEQHRDQILLYLAGALDEQQQQALEEHLDTSCPVCAAYMAEAEATLANLALALPPDEPSVGSRERLMARVQRDRQDTARAAKASAAPSPRDSPTMPESRSRSEDADDQTMVFGGRRRGMMARLLPMGAVAAAAAVVTAIVLLGPLTANRERVAELEQQLHAAGETVTEHESSMAQMSRAMDGTANLFDSLYSSAMQMVSFRSEDESYADAVARLLWDEERNVCHFFVRSLRPPSEGKVYHLWLVTEDDRMVRAGRFKPDEDGGMHIEFELPNGVESFSRAAVSYANADADDADDLRGTLVMEGLLR
ncbi:anti-sigma factor domain-containing protein [Phycisphaerales bacterium AB-hyl4]|uniref:Regulator of SigK n=1 Tax=Natronomicrosphaera hydrolytica TaxID=3242702 RepID=A0ABV4U860_9BACT